MIYWKIRKENQNMVLWFKKSIYYKLIHFMVISKWPMDDTHQVQQDIWHLSEQKIDCHVTIKTIKLRIIYLLLLRLQPHQIKKNIKLDRTFS